MKNFLIKCLFFMCALLALTAQAQTQSAASADSNATSSASTNNDADSQLIQLLSSFQSMTAQFQQMLYGAKGRVQQTSSGQMALQRPGKFRWQVNNPNPQLLITNGQTLWIYDIDLGQATQQQLDTSKNNSPASLLSGSTQDIENRFNISSETKKQPGQWFKLTPKNKDDMFKWIELHFVNSTLTDMRLVDNIGSRTDFHFQNVKINPKLSSSQFKFKAPKGVQLIKN